MNRKLVKKLLIENGAEVAWKLLIGNGTVDKDAQSNWMASQWWTIIKRNLVKFKHFLSFKDTHSVELNGINYIINTHDTHENGLNINILLKW